MTTACRFVPTPPRMGVLRTAEARPGRHPLRSSSPTPLSPLPEDAARSRAGGAGSAALELAGAALALRSRRQCI